MSRALAVTRIKDILRAYSPPFQRVWIGEPLGLPIGIDRAAAAWFMGEAEKTQTFGNVMVAQTWRVRVYWRPRLADADREALELAVWDCCRDLQADFRADSDLGGNVSAIQIELAEGYGWIDVGALESGPERYRVLTFDLTLWELEAEVITQ